MISLLFKSFFIKIQPNISEQEKKWQRIYNLLNSENKPKNFQNKQTFFMASIKPRPYPPWLCYMEHFRKRNKCNILSKYWFGKDFF